MAAASPFAALAAELRAAGFDAHARAIEDALLAGATGTECLGLAGRALRDVRRALPRTTRDALAPAIDACARAVRKAWPAYRV